MTFDSIIGVANVIGDTVGMAALGLGFYVRSTAQTAIEKRANEFDRKLEGAVKALYDRINVDHDRISHLEGVIDDMPRRQQMHELSLQLAEMAGDLKAINAKMVGIEQSSAGNALALRRVENHLFEVRG